MSRVLDVWFFRCCFIFAALSELVDGLHSKCSVRDGVWVRVPEAVRVPRQLAMRVGVQPFEMAGGWFYRLQY